jgi:hypothetical protein
MNQTPTEERHKDLRVVRDPTRKTRPHESETLITRGRSPCPLKAANIKVRHSGMLLCLSESTSENRIPACHAVVLTKAG